MKVLVTGAAGFIGSHTSHRLLDRGDSVIGLDNLNDYYDVTLKQARLKRLESKANFECAQIDVADTNGVKELVRSEKPDRVVHLAAQAGVRYSIENPYAYIEANVTGFLNILESLKEVGTEHLVFASTSSVYGANTNMPFSVHDNVDHPVSLYAATKKSNELMAHTYAHLFGLPATGLRFFTVYGPWGRPDMALFKFTDKMLKGEAIDVFNYGHHKRDFTYVDDIVEGIVRTLDQPATPNPDWTGDAPDSASAAAPYRIYNIGSNNPIDLLRYIEVLEQNLGVEAKKNMLPLQPGDVPDTYADVDALMNDVGYKPDTTIETGIANFVDWYREYYGINER
ncbi:MAG: NAD-dependent epimerase [Pseudomonadaceae bacterium]|nr:NAD-dependent epimerase [Pseudomonadaceae bacterium]